MNKKIWYLIYPTEIILLITYYTLNPPMGDKYLVPSYIGRGIVAILIPTAIIHYYALKKQDK